MTQNEAKRSETKRNEAKKSDAKKLSETKQKNVSETNRKEAKNNCFSFAKQSEKGVKRFLFRCVSLRSEKI